MKNYLAILVGAFVLAAPGFVQAETDLGNTFKLQCDFDGEEIPMKISASDGQATVFSKWDQGAGILTAHYTKLDVVSFSGQTTITAPRLATQPGSVHISLKLGDNGKYVGVFSIVSTDGSNQSNSGRLECSVQ